MLYTDEMNKFNVSIYFCPVHVEAGVRIGRKHINNQRYANDTTLLAENKEELMKLLQTVKKESEKLVFI